ncbi:MAG: pyridoxine 5'-phosphate synthase [Gammaproteobacteria bacterium]|jgi:pyridoxine 5-phosphate synthase|nr:pyridoxine 5'-phosphate synthase [Gammaproteobacteria bacterium]
MSAETAIELGVNIDHVATIRQARGTPYPDPVEAAQIAEDAGAEGITIHLREDRRHIQDRDLEILSRTVRGRLNLEMAASEEMLGIAEHWRPSHCCLVPERRAELTTEGGLNVLTQQAQLTDVRVRLAEAGITLSLFINPDARQIDAAMAIGAPAIELHTGQYADALTPHDAERELKRIVEASEYAHSLGLRVNAGHGLHYGNVQAIARISPIVELNIGHAIVARALFVGLGNAVKEMKTLMTDARR